MFIFLPPDPPHNLGISSDKHFHKVPLGSTYKLTCSLSSYGNPKATIHWFKHSDKIPLQSGIPGFPLTMKIKAMNEQNISYVCVANNSVAEVRKEVNITIEGKCIPFIDMPECYHLFGKHSRYCWEFLNDLNTVVSKVQQKLNLNCKTTLA